MTNRAIAADVIAITGTTSDSATITTFISIANSIVNTAIADGCDVTDTTILKQAEAMLASHLLPLSGAGENGGGKVKIEEKFENWSVKYAVGAIAGEGINSTFYGQTANMLLKGCLSNMTAERATVGFF